MVQRSAVFVSAHTVEGTQHTFVYTNDTENLNFEVLNQNFARLLRRPHESERESIRFESIRF